MEEAMVGPAAGGDGAPPPPYDGPPPTYEAAAHPEAPDPARIVHVASHMHSADGGVHFSVQRANGQQIMLPFGMIRGAGTDVMLRYVSRRRMTPKRLYQLLVQSGATAQGAPPAYAEAKSQIEYDVDAIMDHAYFATGEVCFTVRWADGTSSLQPYSDIKGTADDALLRYVVKQKMTARNLYDLLIRSGAAD